MNINYATYCRLSKECSFEWGFILKKMLPAFYGNTNSPQIIPLNTPNFYNLKNKYVIHWISKSKSI
jgi:hypothetical protein